MWKRKLKPGAGYAIGKEPIQEFVRVLVFEAADGGPYDGSIKGQQQVGTWTQYLVLALHHVEAGRLDHL